MPPDYPSQKDDKMRREDARYAAFWQTVDQEREVQALRAQLEKCEIRRLDEVNQVLRQLADINQERLRAEREVDALRRQVKVMERAYMALDLFVHATKRKQEVPTYLVRAWDEMGKALGRPNHTAEETGGGC